MIEFDLDRQGRAKDGEAGAASTPSTAPLPSRGTRNILDKWDAAVLDGLERTDVVMDDLGRVRLVSAWPVLPFRRPSMRRPQGHWLGAHRYGKSFVPGVPHDSETRAGAMVRATRSGYGIGRCEGDTGQLGLSDCTRGCSVRYRDGGSHTAPNPSSQGRGWRQLRRGATVVLPFAGR